MKELLRRKKNNVLLNVNQLAVKKSKDSAYAAASDVRAVASFNLRKVLPCAQLQSTVVCYKRQLVFHHFNVSYL